MTVTASRCCAIRARGPGRTSEDHEHPGARIWWLTCGNAERPGLGSCYYGELAGSVGGSVAVGEGEVEEPGWFGQVKGS